MTTPLSQLQQQRYFHQSAVKIDDIHTEFLTCEYRDRLWIMISQTGKPGTVTLAESERPAPAPAAAVAVTEGASGDHAMMAMMMAMKQQHLSSSDSVDQSQNIGVPSVENAGDGCHGIDMAIYNIETLFGKARHDSYGDDSDVIRIDLEQILSRQLLQLVSKDDNMSKKGLHTKPILLILGLNRQFEREILDKTERGKDYMRLLVDFTKQTLTAGLQ